MNSAKALRLSQEIYLREKYLEHLNLQRKQLLADYCLYGGTARLDTGTLLIGVDKLRKNERKQLARLYRKIGGIRQHEKITAAATERFANAAALKQANDTVACCRARKSARESVVRRIFFRIRKKRCIQLVCRPVGKQNLETYRGNCTNRASTSGIKQFYVS